MPMSNWLFKINLFARSQACGLTIKRVNPFFVCGRQEAGGYITVDSGQLTVDSYIATAKGVRTDIRNAAFRVRAP
jgi:hypothetical protein